MVDLAIGVQGAALLSDAAFNIEKTNREADCPSPFFFLVFLLLSIIAISPAVDTICMHASILLFASQMNPDLHR